MKKITLILILILVTFYQANAQKIGGIQFKTHETSPTTDCFNDLITATKTFGKNTDGSDDETTATVEIDNSLTPNDTSKHIVMRVASDAVFAEILNDDGQPHSIDEFLVVDSIDDDLSISKLAKGKTGNKIFTFGDICTSAAGNKVLYFIVDIENGFSSTGTKTADVTLKLKTGELKLKININTTAATASFFSTDNNLISYSPNPAGDLLKVSSTKTIDQLSLLDMTGKIVSNKNTNSKVTTINTSNLISGIYILKATINGKVITKKIVKN
ncbi:MAG: T9SS type A sorting domain-containing protein [Flavicella sp.]